MSVSSQIDAMVQSQAQQQNVAVIDNSSGVTQGSATVEPVEGGGITATALRIEGAAPSLLHDDLNVDFAGTVSAMQGNISRLTARLDEKVYDKNTGAPSYVVPEGSRERSLLQQQRTAATNSLTYQVERMEALKAQREVVSQAQPAHDPRSLAAFLANGNPVLAKQIIEAVERQNAEQLASLIRSGGVVK